MQRASILATRDKKTEKKSGEKKSDFHSGHKFELEAHLFAILNENH